MGCDIHIVIERQDENGNWWRVSRKGAPEQFDDRNYDLFGILADVRNGHGFAGIPTGSGWPSIAPSRGVPTDSTITEAERHDYTLGDHSFTWVGLDELKAFDWDGVKSETYGVVTREEYARMQRESESRPKSWCGGISGAGVLVVTPEQLMDGPIPFSHVRMTWTETAREGTRDWAGEVLPWLESVADGHPLRLVFGFDS